MLCWFRITRCGAVDLSSTTPVLRHFRPHGVQRRTNIHHKSSGVRAQSVREGIIVLICTFSNHTRCTMQNGLWRLFTSILTSCDLCEGIIAPGIATDSTVVLCGCGSLNLAWNGRSHLLLLKSYGFVLFTPLLAFATFEL